MRMQVAAAIALAALVLAVILTIAPHTTIVANEVSGEVYAVDILGLTTSAKELLEHQ